MDSDTLSEIKDLNMTYLLLAKQLLAEDKEAGM
ncbi:MAG: flagellar transcriptional activator FlhD, partial [Gammaproteobacteria bacterium]